MYRLERKDHVLTPYVMLWSLLGFQAGFINAFGFLVCGRYVSHVTGFGTQIGIALGSKQPLLALELLGSPTCFILGAFFSGLITSARIERELKPRFDLVTLALPLIMLVLFVAGRVGQLGPFEEPLTAVQDFVVLFILSFFCGMQNGCFSVLTNGHIRTTHMTGMSTDMGTDMARLWFGKISDRELMLTYRTNFSRLVTSICFALGSIVSILLSQKYEYSSLAVPLVTSFIVFFWVRSIGRKLDKRFAKAAWRNS